MTSSQSNIDSARCAMEALGLQWCVAKPLLLEIRAWVSNCGLEYSIGRLKQLKQLYVAKLSGIPLKQGDSWIACRGDGLPKGRFGVLMRRYPPEVVLNVLNVYHSYVFDRVTVRQWKKFLDSATAEPTNPSSVSVSIPKEVKPWDYSRPPYQVGDYYAAFQAGLQRLTLTRSEGARRRYVKVQEQSWVDTANGIGTAGVFAKEFIPQLRVVLGMSPQPNVRKHHRDGVVGRLSYTQETGGKLRVFAIPDLPWQALLDPLKQYLFRQLHAIREDCTFDQESGVTWARNQLSQGKVLHSVDLSDATNHFPWFLQKDLLQSLKVPLMFRVAMERVAKGEYIIPLDVPSIPGEGWNDGVRTMRFQKGQPLGAGPSFALFALAHHCVLRGCPAFRPGGDQYRILGDDIVIADDSLASEYRSLLQTLNVPVAESKTIVSGQLAEFAGWLITSSTAYKPWKWKKISDKNFITVLTHFRRFPAKLLSRDQREFAELVWDVLTPLGAGHNPKGIPFVERYTQFLEIQEYLESTKKDTTWSSQGETWDALASLYGTRGGMDAPFPRQAGLQLQGLLHNSERRDVAVPRSPLEPSPANNSRLLGYLRENAESVDVDGASQTLGKTRSTSAQT